MNKNVASQKITLFAFTYTTGAPKTGDAANLTAYVSKDDGAVTVLTDTSATELDATNAPGWYSFDVTQTETNADKLVFSAKSATANVTVVGAVLYTTPASFTAFVTPSGASVNATQLAGQTIIAAAGVTFPTDVASPTNITAASGVALTAAYDAAKTAATQASVDAVDDFIDTEVASILAAVDTEVSAILALLDDARAEPGQGAPAVNPDAMTKIDYLYKFARNKIEQTATTLSIYDDAGTTVDHKATVSDDATTYTRGEIVAGP